MNGILAATLMVGGTGLLIGILLGIAGKKFYVEVDERETKVREALPGNNCGGCGYPGCDGAAAAVVKGEAPVSVCPVGGAPVAAAGFCTGRLSEELRKRMSWFWKLREGM